MAQGTDTLPSVPWVSWANICLVLIVATRVTAQPNPPPPPSPLPNPMAIAGNGAGYDMAPETRPEVVAAAVAAISTPIPPGPFQPTWDSLRANYQVPQWFVGAKFGIFMHWGLYAVPAHHNEWYEKHMYSNAAIRQWHVERFGAIDRFGYKDFIPRFTAEKFNADAWAELFEKAGAKFVIPTAQHHDNFALWDSKVTRYNAKVMGPKRDLIGELATSIRARGLKFGVSNHGIENFQFVNPAPDLAAELMAKKVDLYDPAWMSFYQVADRSDAACQRFLVDWFERTVELIEKYQPDMLWFDNGVDIRYLDPLKLRIAAYYYNRAANWGKEVSLSTKKAAFAPSGLNDQQIGSIVDFEKVGPRSPSGIRSGVWQVDDAIGSTWGYTEDMKISTARTILTRLIDTVSKNGTYLLNISPRADGTIPTEQQETLLEIGRWLKVNGEAIYGTHNWTTFGSGGIRGDTGPHIRFTVKGDALYAIVISASPSQGDRNGPTASKPKPSAIELNLPLLGRTASAGASISRVQLLGGGDVTYSHEPDGLKITLPSAAPSKHAYTLKITGLKMNPPTWTRDGNPR